MIGVKLKIEKIYWYLLFLVNVLFCFLYVVLSYHNRLAHDDYYFLNLVNELGVFGAVQDMYLKWTPRYLSFLVTHSITLLTSKNALFLFGYHLIVLGMLNLAFFMLLKQGNWFKLKSKFQYLNLSCFLSGVLFFSSFRIGESWFWLAANNYLLSVIAALFVLSFLLKQGVNGFDYIFLSIFSAFIGGSNGVFALFLIGTLVLVFITIPVGEKKSLKRKLALSVFFCFLAFLILYLGPGNRIRETAFPDISILFSLLLNFKMTGIILLKRMPPIFFVVVFLSLILSPLFNVRITTWHQVRKSFIMSTILFGLLVFLFQWPITYKTSDVGAYRALLPLVVLLVSYTLFNVINLKGVIALSDKQMFSYTSWLLGLCIVFGLFFVPHSSSLVIDYSAAVDSRINIIENHKGNSIIRVNPLPSSGLLYSSEISKDSNYFTNRFLQLGLKSPASIILKP